MAIMEQTTNVDQDDEEWYPPSPPIYDVAGKIWGSVVTVIEFHSEVSEMFLHPNDPLQRIF